MGHAEHLDPGLDVDARPGQPVDQAGVERLGAHVALAGDEDAADHVVRKGRLLHHQLGAQELLDLQAAYRVDRLQASQRALIAHPGRKGAQ